MNDEQRPEYTNNPDPEEEGTPSDTENTQPEMESAQKREENAQPEDESAQPVTEAGEPEAESDEPEAASSEPEAESAEPEAAPAPAPEPAVSSEPATEEAAASGESGPSKDSLNLGMLCHLLALCGIVIWFAGNILGPLIIWLLKKDQDPYVDEQGKESLNFQISVTIYLLACVALTFTLILAPVVAILIPIIGLAALALTIIGAIKASKGEPWQYPLTIRLIK